MSMCVKIRGRAWALAQQRCSARRSAVASLIMADTHHAKGPVKAFWASGSELFPSWLNGGDTSAAGGGGAGRGKSESFQLLLMLGLTMLFAAFGLMS